MTMLCNVATFYTRELLTSKYRYGINVFKYSKTDYNETIKWDIFCMAKIGLFRVTNHTRTGGMGCYKKVDNIYSVI